MIKCICTIILTFELEGQGRIFVSYDKLCGGRCRNPHSMTTSLRDTMNPGHLHYDLTLTFDLEVEGQGHNLFSMVEYVYAHVKCWNILKLVCRTLNSENLKLVLNFIASLKPDTNDIYLLLYVGHLYYCMLKIHTEFHVTSKRQTLNN